MMQLSVLKHDLDCNPEVPWVANTTSLLSAGANRGKSSLEACKLAITPSGQLIQWSLISDTLIYAGAAK